LIDDADPRALVMTLPIIVQPLNGSFTAAVLGAPNLRATGVTDDAAVEALKTSLSERLSSGEIRLVEVEPKGLIGLAGKYQNDEAWAEVVADIYRERNEQKSREFPE
jgi:hypothetical protein